MNWRLLDIRVGRANRMQFLVLFGIYIGLTGVGHMVFPNNKGMFDPGFPLKFFLTPALPLTIAAYYFFYLALFRRCRDVGSTILAYIFLFGTAFKVLTVLIPPLFSITLVVYYAFTLPGSVAPYVIIAIALFSLIYLLRPGDKDPNQYGYPPIGLNFRTMVTATYPKDLIQGYKDKEQKAYEAHEAKFGKSLTDRDIRLSSDDEDVTVTEYVEFKGRSK